MICQLLYENFAFYVKMCYNMFEGEAVYMTIVRIKIKDETNNKNKFLVILITLLILFLLVLVFNPISHIKSKLISKHEQSLNTTPTYETLKNVELVKNTKYSCPVFNGKYKVDNNIVKVTADSGSYVRSVDNGIISQIGSNNTYGNYIEICCSKLEKEDIYLFYGNLNKPINSAIIVIQKGQKLGEVGNSGFITFEIRDKNHNILNPYEYMNLSN